MNERLLQYIWSAQHFNTSNLETTSGEPVRVIEPGRLNTNQGPDFLDARIQINNELWIGSVELHIRKADWDQHKHSEDENYRNVILHVIWKNEEQINKKAGSDNLPTLELSPLVSKIMLDRYEQWMNLDCFIPCQSSIGETETLHLQSWKDRIMIERWMRKTEKIKLLLSQNNFHWEETTWWLMARNFGNPVNADAFETMARSIPFNIISRHRNQIIQLEAILLGQSGLLNGRYKEAYPNLLQKEYRYQRNKYCLRPILMPVHFLRMRPGNFPTIRLAQLAMLLYSMEHIFSIILESENIKSLKKNFDIIANDYWHYHYRLDEAREFKLKHLGGAMVDSMLMNTVCPLLFAYGYHHGDQKIKDKAIDWMQQISPENNRIIRKFETLGIHCYNSFDSQSILELKSSYCDQKRCLECGIGQGILGREM